MITNEIVFLSKGVMLLSKWFYVNLAVVGLLIWKITSSYFNIHILFGILGFLFFMFNWMRHAMFATLRSNIDRKRKIKFANISKKVMPIHRWTGTIALIFVLLHSSFIIYRFGFQPDNYKMMFGFMAGIVMCAVVFSGWIRYFKTTVWKRIIHLSLGFTLLYLIIISVT